MGSITTNPIKEANWLYHPLFPESWVRHPLYSLATWVNGMAFRNINFTPTGRPVIKIAEIKGGITAQTKFTDSEYDERYFIIEGDIAFYDALEVNDSAVALLGDKTLRLIAQELVKSVRNSITIDWTVRENIRAQMRVIIKRILRKYGYPPDMQARATELVLEQAEVLCKEWSISP